MRILIIPEDFRLDQYILDPLIRAMLAYIGKPRARIAVCRDPVLGGVEQALDWERIAEVMELYPMVDLFLLIVDRDGLATRRPALDRIEVKAASRLGNDRLLLGECAWQELEVWVLAGHDLPDDWPWEQVRSDSHPKEVYFEPFALAQGLADAPAGGRKSLAEQAASRYGRIRMLCPEDVANLEGRIRAFIA